MAKIRVLPDKMVNLIAAGEVVERPASVVKELVENSIDAGATQISIEIKGDGREMIKVSDNGEGMCEEDVKLAFERHATSKIIAPNDLDQITTLGFRGEALPSIANVAHVEMISRCAGEELATKAVVIGGKIDSVEKTSRSVGTTVKVSNLFFNTPARARFLKSKATEIRHSTQIVATHAMSHYWIGIRLLRDRNVISSLPPCESIEERVNEIFGKGFAESSIAFDLADETVHIYGFLSRPDNARRSSGLLSIFVNSRPVECRAIVRAVCSAYGSSLQANRYPTGIVMIDLDPTEIDVNVHPTKRQIRFRREPEVSSFVERAIKSALTSTKIVPPLIKPASHPTKLQFPSQPLLASEPLLVREARQAYQHKAIEVSPIAQIRDSYILAQSINDFYLIDQHAAHERILYEQAYKNLEGQSATVQKLLFPFQVEVTPQEEEVIKEFGTEIAKIGFEVREFGKRTYLVEAVPAVLKENQQKTLLADMIDEIIETRSKSPDTAHMLAAAFACKSAVKAGTRLGEQEIQMLLEQLFCCKMPFFCPHGRPTMIKLSWQEIERRFLRK